MKNSILEAIGNTPLIRLEGFEKNNIIKAYLFAKLEYFNPFGSIKDRSALQIISDAESKGLINRNTTLIEATSGNMGIALSAIASLKGYKSIMVMPANTAEKKKHLVKRFGAQVVLTPVNEGMAGAIEKAKKIAKLDSNIFYTDQFNNYSSVIAHQTSTAPEIQKQTKGTVDVVIAGIGSGGTVTGIAEYFKSFNKSVEIIGVMPKSIPHSIQGIGAGFEGQILNKELIDKIITVTDIEAQNAIELLLKNDGIFTGISAGAVLSAAIQLTHDEKYNDKNIVLIFADNGERYI